MQFSNPIQVNVLATLIQAKIIGDNNIVATGINEINSVQNGDIVFVDHPKYYDKCLQSKASVIIINAAVDCPANKVLLLVDNPFEAYETIVQHYRKFEIQQTPISATATIHETAIIFPNVFIGHNVTIGKHCVIYPNTTIYDNTIIGDNVIIQANTVIGSHAFYYNTKKNREQWYKKMYSCGRVVLHNNVEIGSGCTIDKGVSSDTIIGEGTKLDNLCHVGHDTKIGKNCLFAANVIIGGCAVIKDGVTVWGGSIINKTLTIGENAVILGRTGVSSSIEGGKTYWGTPAQDARTVQKDLIWIKRIPQIWEKIKNL
jgi:UDP-3-O-[3-hydroxymyristoyl] glucosamine N-acyltransferase